MLNEQPFKVKTIFKNQNVIPEYLKCKREFSRHLVTVINLTEISCLRSLVNKCKINASFSFVRIKS